MIKLFRIKNKNSLTAKNVDVILDETNCEMILHIKFAPDKWLSVLKMSEGKNVKLKDLLFVWDE